MVEFCEAAEIKFRAGPDAKGLFFSMRGEMAIYNVALLITHDEEIYQIYITLPVATTDEKYRPLVTEFVTRANHRIVTGHFDFDVNEGKLRYHVGHPFSEKGLDEDAVGRLFATAISTADRYFPALTKNLFGGETPADAIYMADLDCHAEAVDQENAERPSAPPSAALKAAPKPKARRPRKDPRFKSTQELPGLFERKAKQKDSGEGTK